MTRIGSEKWWGGGVLRQRKTAYAKVLSRRGMLFIAPGVNILYFF